MSTPDFAMDSAQLIACIRQQVNQPSAAFLNAARNQFTTADVQPHFPPRHQCTLDIRPFQWETLLKKLVKLGYIVHSSTHYTLPSGWSARQSSINPAWQNHYDEYGVQRVHIWMNPSETLCIVWVF